MQIRSLFYAAAATLILTVPLSIYAQNEVRTLITWQVQKYEIEPTLPSGERDRTMNVKATLTLKNISGRQASQLTLRSGANVEVTSMSINGSTVESTRSEEKIGPGFSLNRDLTRLPSVPAGGIVTVAVNYKLTVKENTASSTLSPGTVQFLPTGYWYPTPNSWFLGRGPDTAPITVKVNGIGGYTAVAAGAYANGAYSLNISGQPFFTVGSWDVSESSGVTVYAPKGYPNSQKRAAELAALYREALTFASGYLGKPADVPLKIVSVRRGAGYQGGGVVLVDESVFRRPKVDALTAMNIIESAVRTWIGGSLTTSGDGYGVVKEGLTRYLANEFLESKFGKDVADVERLRQRVAYAAISKRDGPLTRISPLDDFYYSAVANKGAIIWRLIANKIGKAEFERQLKANSQNGTLDLADLRLAFSSDKAILDALLDDVTTTNLLIGLPQASGGEVRSALRNTGPFDVNVNVRATLANGQTLDEKAAIPAGNFGQVVFKTAGKIERVEVDTEKIYPQTDYSDDIAPRESGDSDPIAAVKRAFDKKDNPGAEAAAVAALREFPQNDDARTLLGRAQLAMGRMADAEKTFQMILDEKLPTARSLAWASVGLGEVAAAAGRKDQAAAYATAAIMDDADYGASLAARNLRNKLGVNTPVDPAVKAFFTEFDRVAVSNRKADLDALFAPGDAVKFANGMAGSTVKWATQLKQVDELGNGEILAETLVDLQLLTRDPESKFIVYRLKRIGSSWKIVSVDMYESR